MIMICERCCSPIGRAEPKPQLGHIVGVNRSGDVTWAYAYVHTAVCPEPRRPPHPLPDIGEWDPARRVGGHRA